MCASSVHPKNATALNVSLINHEFLFQYFVLGILYSRLISGLGSLLILTAEAGFHYRYILFQSLFPVINEELIYSVVIKSVPFMSMLGAHVHYGFSSTPPEKSHSICGLQPNMLNRENILHSQIYFVRDHFDRAKLFTSLH